MPLRLPFFYGWVVLAVAVTGMFASAPGQASILTVFVEPIGRDMGWSRTEVSASLSIATFVTALLLPLSGYLFDRVGARVIITSAAVLLGAACLATSRVDTVPELYAGVTAARLLGLGVLYLTSTTLVARWFVRRRGRAMAAAVIGMAVGLAVFPPVLQQIIGTAGWRAAWVFLGIAVWVLLVVPAALFIRNRPEDLGLLPDGARDPATSAGPVNPQDAPVIESAWRVSEVIRQRTFWLLILATAIPFIVNVAVAFNQMPVLTDNGLSPNVAALTVSLYAISFSAGSLAGGWLADRFPVRYSLIGTLLVLSLTVLLLLNARTLPVALAFGISFGLSAGANSTIERLIWPTYYGREHLGRINGVVLFIQVSAASSGPVLAGLTFDALGSYAPFFTVIAVLPVLCAFATWLVGQPVARPRPSTA